MGLNYLNLGCGSRCHPDWINVDSRPSAPGVLVHDLSEGIPFADESVDVVYHSHLLEHLTKKHAVRFMKECFRVLKRGGIIRIVVPDLEIIATQYLTALKEARNGNTQTQQNYEWLMLELYDQAVREASGGAMVEYLSQNPICNEAYVLERMGEEARAIINEQRASQNARAKTKPMPSSPLASLKKLRNKLYWWLLRCVLGDTRYHALQIGLFRSHGEVHQWMYDQYSLTLLLERSRFSNPIKTDALHSSVPNWKTFCLDSDLAGRAYKPDSLYIEASKASK
jgi:predicted SAM-dependent methyltransferase